MHARRRAVGPEGNTKKQNQKCERGKRGLYTHADKNYDPPRAQRGRSGDKNAERQFSALYMTTKLEHSDGGAFWTRLRETVKTCRAVRVQDRWNVLNLWNL